MTRILYAIKCVATDHVCYLFESEDDATLRMSVLYASPWASWKDGELYVTEVYVQPKRKPLKPCGPDEEKPDGHGGGLLNDIRDDQIRRHGRAAILAAKGGPA